MMSYKKWRTVIIDHYQNPVYFGFVEHPLAIQLLTVHTSCADQLNLQLVISNEQVGAAHFTGYACAIATASTDIICQTITNKTKQQAMAILNNYALMISEKTYNAELLEDLLVFNYTKNQPNRKNCALLASNGFLELFSKKGVS